MSILTKPSISKGTPATLSLSKSALLAIVTDPDFQDATSWKTIEVYYKSSTGSQRKMVEFDATLSSPSKDVLFSLKSKNDFQVEKVVIVDLDGGRLPIRRAQLTSSEFDISMVAGGGATGPAKFSAALARSTMTVATDGLSISNARGDYMHNAYLNNPITLATAGKFIVEFEIVNSTSYLYFGGSFVSNVSEFTTGNFGEISNGWPLMSSSPEGNKGFNYQNGGPLYLGTTSSGVTFGGFTNGDKICIAIDTSNHKIWIGKNGVFPQGADPATNTGGATFSTSATFAYLGLALSNGTVKVVTPSVIPSGFVQL